MEEVSALKIRIKFEKTGVMKFIGHLDIMRYFQKAMRRAEIDIAYSGGYSPHQIMSFASPLGIGLTSEGEYLDIEINSEITSKEAVDRLNAVMADGVHIISFRELSDSSKNAMSLVAAADYEITFIEGKEPSANWKEALMEFYHQEEITILKKSKKSETITDIKPMIYTLSIEDERIFMQVAAGSVNNLKPELVMEAFYNYLETDFDKFAFYIHRKEVLGLSEKDGIQSLIPLEDMGEEIV